MQAKIILDPQPLLFPYPVVLVGAKVNDKPSFTTISWTGIVNSEPPILSISVRPGRHIYRGIVEHRVFSVNIPSESMLAATDYCGVASGANTDKVADCGFSVFYGRQTAAPLISEAPVNLECKVLEFIPLGTHHLILGEILCVHVSESCTTLGKPDVDKIKPFVYSTGQRKEYRGLTPALAPAYAVKRKES